MRNINLKQIPTQIYSQKTIRPQFPNKLISRGRGSGKGSGNSKGQQWVRGQLQQQGRQQGHRQGQEQGGKAEKLVTKKVNLAIHSIISFHSIGVLIII